MVAIESLHFYIKEHKPFIFLYGICLSLGVLLFISDIYNILNGNIDRTIIKSLLTSILLVPGIILYVFYFKKVFSVYQDYKTQKKETKILYLDHQSYSKCLDEFNGAYKFFFCFEKPNGKRECYWLYRKDLMYNDLTNCIKYKVTYYKKSKCLYSIEPVCNDIEKPKKQPNEINTCNTDNTDLSATLNSIWFPYTHRPLLKLFKGRSDKQEFITETITAIGIPVKRRFKNSDKQEFLLRVQTQNGKKKALLFNSTVILGLGDLSQRAGYMGYGNFIGTEYEIEYSKHSHIVKSLSIILYPSDT